MRGIKCIILSPLIQVTQTLLHFIHLLNLSSNFNLFSSNYYKTYLTLGLSEGKGSTQCKANFILLSNSSPMDGASLMSSKSNTSLIH
ncbi:hypothetical protein MtrunA17_Chr4g0005741 [Medicago truncatula]|uniref:Uncharacterized protein n=1 Tax=Medicago truncatula TaxID=3880 RepID=A0A396HZH2_MEDTR|nr:hypothetical protein MtrunA17_Chr4g0005741 [Medicago truncatula]